MSAGNTISPDFDNLVYRQISQDMLKNIQGLKSLSLVNIICLLSNRRWCDLPELPVPLEDDWFCRLWRI